MTEFVAPYSKQHLFIVLHEYNSKPEPILCEAQVIRDSSFFPASTNTYVAAMSFRVSMFGNADSGFVYQYIPPEYMIAADLDKVDEAYNKKYIETKAVSPEYDFDLSKEKNYITLQPTGAIEATGEETISFANTNVENLVRGSAGAINKYMITDESVIQIQREKEDTYRTYAEVQLTQNPSLFLNGPGWGAKGLGTMKGKLHFREDPFSYGLEGEVQAGGWNDI